MVDGFPEPHPVHLQGLKVEDAGKLVGPEPGLVLADVHPSVGHPVHLVPDKESAVVMEAAAAAQPADAAAARRKPDAALSAV
jgi:hypothetical protein